MNTKNKEFLLKHLGIVINDLNHFIEREKIVLITASRNNYLSIQERVALNSKIVKIIQEKLMIKQCIEEISNL